MLHRTQMQGPWPWVWPRTAWPGLACLAWPGKAWPGLAWPSFRLGWILAGQDWILHGSLLVYSLMRTLLRVRSNENLHELFYSASRRDILVRVRTCACCSRALSFQRGLIPILLAAMPFDQTQCPFAPSGDSFWIYSCTDDS